MRRGSKRRTIRTPRQTRLIELTLLRMRLSDLAVMIRRRSGALAADQRLDRAQWHFRESNEGRELVAGTMAVSPIRIIATPSA
jgi:hypothetical protein